MRTCKVIKLRIAQGIPLAPSDALTTAENLRIRHTQPRRIQDNPTSGRSTSPEEAEVEDEGSEVGWPSSDWTTATTDDHPSPSSPSGFVEAPGYFVPHPAHGSHDHAERTYSPVSHHPRYQALGRHAAYLYQPNAAPQGRLQVDPQHSQHNSSSIPQQSRVESTYLRQGVQGNWRPDHVGVSAGNVGRAAEGLSEVPLDGQNPRYTGHSFSPPSGTFGPLAIPPHRRHHEPSDQAAESAGGAGHASSNHDFSSTSGQYRTSDDSPAPYDLGLERSPVSSHSENVQNGPSWVTAGHEALSSEPQGGPHHNRITWEQKRVEDTD